MGFRELQTRRRLLAAAAVASVPAILSGCGVASGPARVASAGREGNGTTTLVVHSVPLYSVRRALVAAWSAEFPKVTLKLTRQFILAATAAAYGAEFLAAGDVLDDSESLRQQFVNLAPYLRVANVNPSAFASAVAHAYDLGAATVRSVPLFVSEFQFYASPVQPKHPVGHAPERWTLAEVVAACDAGAASSPGTPMITGTNWGDPRIWGAFVLGLGGGFSADHGIDLSGAAQATEYLVRFARRIGWKPVRTGSMFGTEGFSNVLSNTLFALAPPWTVQDIGNVLGSTSSSSVMSTLPTQPFLLFPKHPVVPAYAVSGLGVSPRSKQPALASQFLTWCLAPAQQRLLADQGFPPVIADASVQAYWSRVSKTFDATLPRFTWGGYTDVMATLPHAAGGTRLGGGQLAVYEEALSGPFLRMYQGADVRTELKAAENAIRPYLQQPA